MSHVSPHCPLEHTGLPPDVPGQIMPHAPQFSGSDPCVFTQEEPQSVKPLPQSLSQLPAEHTGVVPLQACPHVPQSVAEEWRLASHPLVGSPSQFA